MDEKYLINDIGAKDERLTTFTALGLTVLSAEDLTKLTLTAPIWQELGPKNTLIVFPGNGGNIVYAYLPASWREAWWHCRVEAKRAWAPGHDPEAMVGRVYERGFLLGVKNIVIFDDVISSGCTARALLCHNSVWIPNARWHAVTWIKQRSADLRHFASRFAACEVGSNKKAPINSLSTLRDSPAMAERYAGRNFSSRGNLFLAALAELR